ncbi:MAG TPA: hypothetical protein ENJ08_06695 [Gammaproteobacteria bacterium]|nr:hypothetical protein [Gammaproteobacteria bacterium]
MTLMSMNDGILKKFGKYSIFTGFLLMLIGITGAVIPEIMSLETAIFIALFMLMGGLFWAIHTFQYARSSVMDWLKPLVLIAVGGMVLFSPEQGVAALGLFLAFYLMIDAFGSFSIAQAYYPAKGWGWMLINGIMSVLLSILFIFGWPQTSLWLVGLFVAISLFFDGLALVIIGWMAKKVDS